MNPRNNHNETVGNSGDRSTCHVTTTDRPLAQFARTRDYWLGGKDNGAIDQAVGEHIAELLPDISAQMRCYQKSACSGVANAGSDRGDLLGKLPRLLRSPSAVSLAGSSRLGWYVLWLCLSPCG